MLITDKNELFNYSIDKRLWQGIPSIEVSKNGRIFLTYYSGGTKEEVGNFCILSKSDDGEHFEDVAITFQDGARCYDPCLWIDPLGRLWFTWAVDPDRAVWASVCDDPDARNLIWSEPKRIGREVMMNKPTVLSTGEWRCGMCSAPSFNNRTKKKSSLSLTRALITERALSDLADAICQSVLLTSI